MSSPKTESDDTELCWPVFEQGVVYGRPLFVHDGVIRCAVIDSSDPFGGDADIEVNGPWSTVRSNILSLIPHLPRCIAEKSLMTESTERSV